jgi:hypothetical protein
MSRSRDSDACRMKFPYWERLHGFWRTLPNYNPLSISSDPGQAIDERMMGFVPKGIANADPEADGIANIDLGAGDGAEVRVPDASTPNVESMFEGEIGVHEHVCALTRL